MLSLLFFCFVATSYSLSCTAQWQCGSVTNDYNYVACTSGTCKCRTDLGFAGFATTSSKCNCPTPYQVVWGSGSPYCIQFQDAVAYKQNNAQHDLMISSLIDIYRNIFWPAVADVGSNLTAHTRNNVVFGYYDENVKARVDGFGEYYGIDAVVGYGFGQFATGQAMVNQATFSQVVAQGNSIHMRLDLYYTIFTAPPPNNITVVDGYNVTSSGIWEFNDEGKIVSVDVTHHNLQQTVRDVFANQTEKISEVCYIAVYLANCDATKDPLGYYHNYTDCVNFLTSIDYGSWDLLRDNNVICRYFHATLLLTNQPYCTAVGKLGGGRCVAQDSRDYYTLGFDNNPYYNIGKLPDVIPE